MKILDGLSACCVVRCKQHILSIEVASVDEIWSFLDIAKAVMGSNKIQKLKPIRFSLIASLCALFRIWRLRSSSIFLKNTISIIDILHFQTLIKRAFDTFTAINQYFKIVWLKRNSAFVYIYLFVSIFARYLVSLQRSWWSHNYFKIHTNRRQASVCWNDTCQ